MWRALADCDQSRSFARSNGEVVFHPIANIVEGEICWGEQIVVEILEHEDHVMGKGMEEDGECFRGGDGWFP